MSDQKNTDEKKLTVADLETVAGGRLGDIAIAPDLKMEDAEGNKGEAGNAN